MSTRKELQKKYYSAEKEHVYLRYRAEDLYAKNLTGYLFDFARISQAGNILEMGSGAGRFTIHLLKSGLKVTCVDLSEAQLKRLEEDSKKACIPADKLKAHCMPIEDISGCAGGQYDVIIGFFILHHLDTDNLKLYFLEFRKLLKPGGRICFLEPNRLNPLFFFQYIFQKDMDIRSEMGTFKLSRKLLKEALSLACYKDITFKNFGFFPPQIVNRFGPVLRFERLAEKIPVLKRFLPFLLVMAEKQADI